VILARPAQARIQARSADQGWLSIIEQFKKVPVPAILLAAATLLASLIVVVSLYGANDPGPSSSLSVNSSGVIEEGGPSGSARSDAHSDSPAAGVPDPLANAENTFTDDSDSARDGFLYPEAGDAASIPNSANREVTNPDPGPLPGNPDITIWQDRSDSGYNAGSGQGSISGRVTDPWGNGIAGVNVSLVTEYSCFGGGKPPPDPSRWIVAPVITDAMGFYSISSKTWHQGAGYEYRFAESYMPNIFSQSASAPLEGSYMVFFSGTVGGFQASEWYDNKASSLQPYCGGLPEGVASVPAGSSGVDAVLVPQGAIAGKVSGPGSQPSMIAAIPADGTQVEYTNDFYGQHTYSGSNGNFYIGSLAPGSYKLAATPNLNSYYFHEDLPQPGSMVWFNSARSWDSAITINLGAGQVATVDFRFPEPEPDRSDTIAGSLTFYYQPPPFGTEIALIKASKPDVTIIRKTLGPSDYTFAFSGLADGDYKLKCTLPGNARTFWYSGNSYFFEVEPGSNPDDAIIVNPGSRNVFFDVRPLSGKISGTVRYPDGTPVRNVYVWAYNQNRFIESLPTGSSSDWSGEFILGDPAIGPVSNKLMPGTYRVCAKEPGDGSDYCASGLATVGWYSDAAGMDIVIPFDYGSPVEVSGTVRKPDGSGAGGATVKLNSYGETLYSTTADSSGYYRFTRQGDGLELGYYTACAEYRGIDYCDDWRLGRGFTLWWNTALTDIDPSVPDEVGADGY